jgi:predicted small lipoprotein YifL
MLHPTIALVRDRRSFAVCRPRFMQTQVAACMKPGPLYLAPSWKPMQLHLVRSHGPVIQEQSGTHCKLLRMNQILCEWY